MYIFATESPSNTTEIDLAFASTSRSWTSNCVESLIQSPFVYAQSLPLFIIKISNKVIQQILIQSCAFGLFQLYANHVAANFVIVDRVIIGSDG